MSNIIHENKALPDFAVVRQMDTAEPFLDIRNLTVKRPKSGEVLVKDFNLSLGRGESFVLFGESGGGKSSIVRLIKELQHEGSGEVLIGGKRNVFTLAQETQIPRGDLRSILCWPQPNAGQYADIEMQQTLEDVGLSELAQQFANEANPKYLAGLSMPYAIKMFEGWNEGLSKLSDKKRQVFLEKLADYIQKNAQNFYPKTVTSGMDDMTKAELAREVVEVLRKPLSMIERSSKASLRAVFPGGIKEIAQDIGRYALQASNTELRAATFDGERIRTKYSGGQKQKVGWAQIMLQRPDVLLLDEPTSKLDSDSTENLYGLIKKNLSNSIIFGIAHDHSVKEHYTYWGVLENQKITVKKTAAASQPSFYPLQLSSNPAPR